MSDLPETIKHPSTFLNSPAAGYDGVFDWTWTQGCFGQTKITPMDFDGVVERKGNFIVFETKGAGVPVPKGQEYTLERAHSLGVFTIVFVAGKEQPEALKVWHAPDFRKGKKMPDFCDVTIGNCQAFVKAWFTYAENNPKPKVDVTFLNQRITELTTQVGGAKNAANTLVNSLGGRIVWGE